MALLNFSTAKSSIFFWQNLGKLLFGSEFATSELHPIRTLQKEVAYSFEGGSIKPTKQAQICLVDGDQRLPTTFYQKQKNQKTHCFSP